jgi:hypothetical protein
MLTAQEQIKANDKEALIEVLTQEVSDLKIGQDRVILQRHQVQKDLDELKYRAHSCSRQITDTIRQATLSMDVRRDLERIANTLRNF